MSLLQIEGFDSFTTPFTALMMSTKLNVTNPLGFFTVGGAGSALPAGRTSGSAYRPPNEPTAPSMVFEVFPNFRAASAFTDVIIVGFANRITVRGGPTRLPFVRIISSDASEAMELCLFQDNVSGVHRWEVHRGYASAAQFSVEPIGGSSTIIAQTVNNPYPVGTWAYVEFRFKLANTGGIGEIRINGVVDGTFAGDTNAGAGSSINMRHFFFRPGTSSLEFDDMYWLREDGVGLNTYLGDVFVETIRPTGDGNSTDWTPFGAGSHFVEVDDVGFDGNATYISTSTSTDQDLFTYPNLTDITANVIKAVQLSSVDRNEAVGLANLDAVVRTGTPVEFQGTKQGLVQDTPFEGHYQIWDQNPETSLDWTRTEIDASEFGIQLL